MQYVVDRDSEGQARTEHATRPTCQHYGSAQRPSGPGEVWDHIPFFCGDIGNPYKSITINKKQLLLEAKKSEAYKKMLEKFPDAELIDVEIKDEGND